MGETTSDLYWKLEGYLNSSTGLVHLTAVDAARGRDPSYDIVSFCGRTLVAAVVPPVLAGLGEAERPRAEYVEVDLATVRTTHPEARLCKSCANHPHRRLAATARRQEPRSEDHPVSLLAAAEAALESALEAVRAARRRVEATTRQDGN